MSGRDPWVAIDATIRRNPKLAALSSDSARLGWIYALAEAKLQRPSGRFASRAHWAEVAGRFARYIGEYLAVGLLEEASDLCQRCRDVWGELPDGALVVHDWARHQRDPTMSRRVATYRARRNTDVTPPVTATVTRNADVTVDVTDADVTDAVTCNEDVTVISRARVKRQRQRQRQYVPEIEPGSSTSSPPRALRGGAGGERARPDDGLDIVERWLAERRLAVAPASKTGVELARLVDRHGAEAVIEAIRGLGGLHDGRQAVWGAVRVLEPIPDARPRRGYEANPETLAALDARVRGD